ncbi:MAG: hypothetical protein LUG21_06675 [Clostridiales bacterium]|nr:hypothetical protein [Clostridiales bacterium]
MKYCKYCGYKIDEQCVMCPNCQKILNTDFIVTVIRDSQFMAVKSKIKLEIDNSKTYEVDNGETLRIKLPQGNHTFKFHYSFRSKIVNVNLNKNITLSLGWDHVSGAIEVFEVV